MGRADRHRTELPMDEAAARYTAEGWSTKTPAEGPADHKPERGDEENGILKKKQPGGYWKKIMVAAALVLALVCGAVWFFMRGKDKAETVTAKEKVYPVKVMEVSPASHDIYINYIGLVQPQTLTQLTVPTIGTLETLFVSEGDEVRAGDVLARLDDSKVTDAAAQAKESMESARSAMESARVARDEAQARYDSAEIVNPDQQKEEAKKALDEATGRRDAKQKELDEVNAACEPERRAVDEAAKRVEASRAAADKAREEYQKSLEDSVSGNVIPEKRQAWQDAESIWAAEQTGLVSAQNALAQKEQDLGKAQKETELAALKAEVQTLQQAYDTIDTSTQPSVTGKDLLKYQLDAAELNYNSAVSSYNAAKSAYEMANGAVEDTVLVSPSDGYVVTITTKEGAMANPLVPIMVIGSHEMVVNFGVSQADVREISAGMLAEITVNGNTYSGKVLDIGTLPDETSRTYSTNVSIDSTDDGLYLGETASVKITGNEKRGVWLPISVILNNGEDYVMAVEDGRAAVRKVKITDISDDMVCVEGLEEGGMIITEGMKTVKSGGRVSILE